MKPEPGEIRTGYDARIGTAGRARWLTDDDDSEEQEAAIVAQRQHYEARLEILKSHGIGNAAIAVPEECRDESRARGNEAGAAFWNDVWTYLMHKSLRRG